MIKTMTVEGGFTGGFKGQTKESEKRKRRIIITRERVLFKTLIMESAKKRVIKSYLSEHARSLRLTSRMIVCDPTLIIFFFRIKVFVLCFLSTHVFESLHFPTPLRVVFCN